MGVVAITSINLENGQADCLAIFLAKNGETSMKTGIR